MARCVISRLLNLFQDIGNTSTRLEKDNLRAISETDDRYQNLTAHGNRTHNATQQIFGSRTEAVMTNSPK